MAVIDRGEVPSAEAVLEDLRAQLDAIGASDQPIVVLGLSLATALCVLSLLQLALRHRGVVGTAAGVATRQVAEGLARQILQASGGDEEVRQLIEAGWDRSESEPCH